MSTGWVDGNEIERRRVAAGITQVEMAHLIVCSPSTLCRWEQGQRAPNIGNLMTICRVLGCSVSDLLCENLKHP